MVLPTSFHCVSLFVGSVVCTAVSLTFYALAFALELWWIIESQVSLPVPAYLLCALYVVTLILDIFLCVSLIGKKTRLLLSWLVIMAVFYFIEGALVLYMVIQHWTLQQTYGIVELTFWIFRAIFNIIVYVTILSQFSTWRDEKSIMHRLHKLSMGLGADKVKSNVVSGDVMKKDILHHRNRPLNNNNTTANLAGVDGCVMVDLASIHQGYDNLAFATTNSDINLHSGNNSTRMLQPSFMANQTTDVTGRMKRSLSSASQIRLQRSPSLYGGSLPSHGQELIDPATSRLHNQLSLAYTGSSQSEFDASNFSGAFTFPVRSQSELSLKGRTSGGGIGRKPRSLMYLDEDDYLARPPPSRPVSMGYVNVHREFSTQSLDRSRYHRRGYPRKAASLEALDVRELPEFKLQKVAMKPFDYLNRPGSRLGEMMEMDPEELKRIEDVAL
ncbi:hypothetical protein CHUAL_012771 [Chamberlinius hualienensis]